MCVASSLCGISNASRAPSLCIDRRMEVLWTFASRSYSSLFCCWGGRSLAIGTEFMISFRWLHWMERGLMQSVSHKRTIQLALNLSFFFAGTLPWDTFVCRTQTPKLECSSRFQRCPVCRICRSIRCAICILSIFTWNPIPASSLLALTRIAAPFLSIDFFLGRRRSGHTRSKLWFGNRARQDDHAEDYIKRSELCIPALTR